MAKTLKQLENKLRIKFLVKNKKYFLFAGSQQIKINGEYQNGFVTESECEQVGTTLKRKFDYSDFEWATN